MGGWGVRPWEGDVTPGNAPPTLQLQLQLRRSCSSSRRDCFLYPFCTLGVSDFLIFLKETSACHECIPCLHGATVANSCSIHFRNSRCKVARHCAKAMRCKPQSKRRVKPCAQNGGHTPTPPIGVGAQPPGRTSNPPGGTSDPPGKKTAVEQSSLHSHPSHFPEQSSPSDEVSLHSHLPELEKECSLELELVEMTSYSTTVEW